MIRRLFALLIPAAAFGVIATPAFADEWYDAYGVQCRENAIAIRTGGQYYPDPPHLDALPAAYSAAWQDVPVDADNVCKLATGETVVVRFGGADSKLTGPGALDPPAWVSVWIDGKKILSREVYKPGFEQSFDGKFLNSLFISRRTIERCAYTKPGHHTPADTGPGDIVCTQVSFDLGALRIDPLEPSADVASGPAFTFTATYNPDFCRRFIRRWGDVEPLAKGPDADREIIAPPQEASFPFQGDATHRNDGIATEFTAFDYWNDGKPVTAARIWLEDGWAGSANYVFFTVGETTETNIAALREAIPKATARRVEEFDFAALNKLGWYSPTQTEFGSIRLFRLDDSTYFLRGLSDPSGPIALVRPGRAGYSNPPPETICMFQQRKPNF